MCVKLRIFSLCLLLCVFGGQGAHAETLKEVIQKVIGNNPAIQGGIAAKEAADHQTRIEEASRYPDISATATVGRVFQDNATSRGLVTTRGAAYSGYGEANIALRQKIFDGSENLNRINAAQSRAKSKQFTVIDTQEQIILSLTGSYIDITRVAKALRQLKKQRAQTQDYKSRIETLVEQGASDQTELEQAKDVSLIVESAIAEYEGQLAIAKAQYREISGQDPPTQVKIPFSPAAYIDNNIQIVINQAKQDHPAVLSATQEMFASKHDVQAQIAQQYPDVGAELSYLVSDKRDEIGGEVEDARAVVRMNWEFSLGGRGKASVEQRISQHEEAKARKEERERQIEREILEAYTNYKTLKRQMDLGERRVKLNQELVESYKVQFEGSRISLLSLMRAESQLFNALLAHNDNKFNLLSAEYAVLAATGKLKSAIFNVDAKNE